MVWRRMVPTQSKLGVPEAVVARLLHSSPYLIFQLGLNALICGPTVEPVPSPEVGQLVAAEQLVVVRPVAAEPRVVGVDLLQPQ